MRRSDCAATSAKKQQPIKTKLEFLRALLFQAEQFAKATPGLQLYELDLYPIRGRVDLELARQDEPEPMEPATASPIEPATALAYSNFVPFQQTLTQIKRVAWCCRELA
jgi:hypothetical protein